jgi:biotin synthase
MSSQPITFHAARNKISTLAAARDIWPVAEVVKLFELPFNDLLWRAQKIHREHFDANEVELATLLSIKTGGCPEDCGYCPQSAHYDTGVTAEKMMPVEEVVAAAQAAKDSGATRFCMGAAWRAPKDRDLDAVEDMVKAVD